MYKICVVGLGGSGGKTLQYQMDQLRSELGAIGWTADHLPRCWEFVHVDVPPTPDGVDAGLPPTVPMQGGSYIPVSTPTDNYAVLDSALQATLGNQPTGSQLSQLVRWRPNAARVNTPITLGAGQFRAVGRLLTLARARVVYERLVPVAERLNQSAADSDLRELSSLLGLKPEPAQGTLVLVVSSLAGGTGASMTLDVCNLLRAVAAQVPNFRAESLAFLYTPDVFDQLQKNRRAGVNANALGTVAELMSAMAARQQPWTAAEWSVYGGVPRPQAPGRGPMLAFPVGSYNGTSGARFGDGESHTIYRGFARSLTALFLSNSQQNDLQAYAIGNLESAATSLEDRTLLGVQPSRGGVEGETTEPMVFGSIGFASIGLGRERYAEYAAQRLARKGLDRLLRGHEDLSVQQGQRSPQQAIGTTAAEYYPQFLAWTGLPDLRVRNIETITALVDDVWSTQSREALTASTVQDMLGPIMSGPSGKGSYFAQQLAGQITSTFGSVRNQAELELRNAAVNWVPRIQARLETAALRVAGERGLPVAERVLQTFATDLQAGAEALMRSSAGVRHPQEIAQEVTAELQAITSNIDARHGALGQAGNRLREQLSGQFLRQGGVQVGELLSQLISDLLGPLRTGLAQCREELENAETASAGSAPVATVATSLVHQWPVGEDVPSRFATAQNEVLLEDINSYPRAYTDHLVQTFSGFAAGGGTPSADQSEDLAVFEVLTWLHADSRSELRTANRLKGLVGNGYPARIGRRSEWWPQALSAAGPSRQAVYQVDLDHDALLAGARVWVGRANEVMGAFITQGLDAYLSRPGAGPYELEETARRFVDKFMTAVQLAAPLVAVDAGMVSATHGKDVRIGYQFSEMPLGKSPNVVAMIADELGRKGSVDPETVGRMHRAVNQGTRTRSITILGNYSDLYNPIVFSSLQRPIKKQWTESASPQLRGAFWTMRRGRSLVDFVPVSRSWLQSLVTGWMIGRLTGEVLWQGEGPIHDGGVAVWSPAQQDWTRLPHPLLGVEDPARDAPGWELLAAVVESMPLALAQCDGDTQFIALQPYQALFDLGRHLQNPQERQANDALLQWVRHGRGRSGVLPRGAAGAPQAGPAERLDAARGWCEALEAAATAMLPRDHGFPGERGEFSEITPHNFWQVPRDWELAPQLVEGARQLLTNLALPMYTGTTPPPVSVGIAVLA
ncbi:tubulin-like doman-containing protein [Geodermatophilus sp. URMC 64]